MVVNYTSEKVLVYRSNTDHRNTETYCRNRNAADETKKRLYG